MSSVIRSVKNVTKGYSSVQVKVRNATSNDPWGPTGTDMADIAKITYNSSTDFYEVMDMLDKRLNDKGKNWRHVLKSLKVLDYCLHEGSELVVTWARKNIYIIKTLREFIYLDEEGRDVGSSIRHSAKELTSLILDEERLRAERTNRGSWKSRVSGLEDVAGGTYQPPPQNQRRSRPSAANRTNSDDDLEYKLALEASKNEAENEAAKRSKSSANGDDDADLAKALKLSEEEAESRKRDLEDQNNANLLFDDTPATEQAPQATGWNQGYQQQSQVDWYGNPVQVQQSQQTGYLANAYSQPTGQFQNGFGGGLGYNQPQQTGFEQPQQQPSQQFLQPQNTYNPWAQQMQQPQQTHPNGFSPQSPSLPDQPTLQPGSNNPWATSTPTPTLAPQPTGSNNPFAPHRPQSHSAFKAPTLSTLAEQRAQDFPPRPNPITSYTSPMPTSSPLQSQPPLQRGAADPYQAKLNALLSAADGQDTFGNVGDLRIPAQHTAPGTFVNSAGAGSLGRLEASRTGSNPFFTQSAAGYQYPAQTGPAGGNPFGLRPGQGSGQGQSGQGGGQGQGGSLIDL